MREYSAPPQVAVPTTGCLTDDVVNNALDHPDAVVFSRGSAGRREPVTAAEFHQHVRAVAKGLIASGVNAGDRVALLSRTRYEWTLVDYAIWYCGAISVPVYETSPAARVESILSDSGAKGIVIEAARHRELFDATSPELPELSLIWTINDGAIAALVAAGTGVADAELDARRAGVTPASIATLIYTSGTTGDPKGCVLTHGNFMVEVSTAIDALEELFDDGAATLLFLPLAHVFARVIQVGCVSARVRLGYSADVSALVADLREFKPTFLLAVPRVFEKVFNATSQSARIDGKGAIFDRAADAAIAYSRDLSSGTPGPIRRARHAVYDKLVYRHIREALGGSCAYAVSGGAPLGERLGHFYRGIGVTVLEGYGLTETTAAATVNRPGAIRIGSVGQPLAGTTVRVATDGELLVRGGQVMREYWRNPQATAQVLDDEGWLRTGDLGEIDDEGFVRITGRKKEMLVTAGGKNVAPAALEDRIRAHHLVSQCLLVGDGRPFVAALITLDAEAVTGWARQNGKPADLRRLADDADLRAAIQRAVDEANATVSQAESVRRFALMDRDWTEESGELTPSLKVRRSVVLRAAHQDIERLYQSR